MNKDLEIARSVVKRPIADVAADLGLRRDELVPFGEFVAKVRQSALRERSGSPDGKYVDVTAITPTPLGEGKTTTTIGLVQGLGRRGLRAVACIRQPSQGPTFGIKGGAAGGGRAQVVPMEDFNLHLTGDFHAVTAAHNLIAAALDARLLHERDFRDSALAARGLRRLGIDGQNVAWRRVTDTCDRALRNVVLGLGAKGDGVPRQSGFEITAASELMACLALADDLADLRRRIGRVIVAYTSQGAPVTAEDLGAAGAATALMKETVHPNLLQTIEGQGVFVHAGPFANIAHGNSSIIADRLALKLADVVVTESGFGADIGLEKFCDIKCRASGLRPDAVVLVATVRALKMHGGGPRVVPGKPLPAAYVREDVGLLVAGLPNLIRHLEIARTFGVPAVVAVNRFSEDTPRELEELCRAARGAGATAVLTDHWARGGEGAVDLAAAVREAWSTENAFRFLYPLDVPLRQKIETIAREVYGAADVSYSEEAAKDLDRCAALGFGGLPVCMAKTHLSLSHDPQRKGAPEGFTLPVREVRLSAGAGFVYPLCGAMPTMPGLPARPMFMDIDVDADGEVRGIS